VELVKNADPVSVSLIVLTRYGMLSACACEAGSAVNAKAISITIAAEKTLRFMVTLLSFKALRSYALVGSLVEQLDFAGCRRLTAQACGQKGYFLKVQCVEEAKKSGRRVPVEIKKGENRTQGCHGKVQKLIGARISAAHVIGRSNSERSEGTHNNQSDEEMTSPRPAHLSLPSAQVKPHISTLPS
jgi:hypothetical protein